MTVRGEFMTATVAASAGEWTLAQSQWPELTAHPRLERRRRLQCVPLSPCGLSHFVSP